MFFSKKLQGCVLSMNSYKCNASTGVDETNRQTLRFLKDGQEDKRNVEQQRKRDRLSACSPHYGQVFWLCGLLV